MIHNVNEYIDCRLDEWANWYLQYGDFGLGYPRRSIEGRLMDEGGVLIKSTASRDLLCNAEAEEIEKMVLELNQQNSRLAKVLRENYFGFGTCKSKAERLAMSYSSFKTHLDMAKQWLAGRLSTSYQQSFSWRERATNDLTCAG